MIYHSEATACDRLASLSPQFSWICLTNSDSVAAATAKKTD